LRYNTDTIDGMSQGIAALGIIPEGYASIATQANQLGVVQLLVLMN
jgi:hypothetical protein